MVKYAFLMVFQAILRQILNYCFGAISSCELSVCAVFYVFFQLCCHLQVLTGLPGAEPVHRLGDEVVAAVREATL